MTNEESIKSTQIMAELISRSDSMREFARLIAEDVADVSKWKTGKKTLTTRATISICRIFKMQPHELNPDLFPEDLKFIFTKGK